jgi:methylated-DNA-[protein]-cysteine S-methyltransferase
MQKINIEKLKGTVFQKKVWKALLGVKKGSTITYKELARKIGKPSAVRAVANAVGANPIPVTIPCHRVVRSDGTLGGYSGKGGVKTKHALLKKEGVIFKSLPNS